MNWAQITSGSYNKRYPRTPWDESEYQWHKRTAQEMIGSIEEYVKILYIDPLDPYIFIKNRFHYNLETGIKHYLLWINPKYKICDRQAEKIIRERFPTQKIHYHMNSMKFRSILSIDHYHVFIKN